MTVTIRPTGHKLLVQPVKVKNVSDGGIILGDTKREDAAIGLGKVIGIGPTAFISVAGCDPTAYPTNDPRYKMEPHELWGVKIGDVVIYNRYAGFHPDVPEYKEFKVIPDVEVSGVAEGDFEVLKTDF